MRTEGLITQLVFEHSLRIRLKAQVAGDSEAEERVRKASDNLTGRIHNLVTTDLGNLVRGKDFLFIGMYNIISNEFLVANIRFTALFVPLEFSLCMTFLYQVLGWRCVRVLSCSTRLSFPSRQLLHRSSCHDHVSANSSIPCKKTAACGRREDEAGEFCQVHESSRADNLISLTPESKLCRRLLESSG